MCTIFFPAVAPFGAPTLVENTEYSDRLNILVGQFFYNYGQSCSVYLKLQIYFLVKHLHTYQRWHTHSSSYIANHSHYCKSTG